MAFYPPPPKSVYTLTLVTILPLESNINLETQILGGSLRKALEKDEVNAHDITNYMFRVLQIAIIYPPPCYKACKIRKGSNRYSVDEAIIDHQSKAREQRVV